MKRTPREWLLARHASARPALDEVRRSVLPEPPLDLRGFLRALFVPARRSWTLIALFWLTGIGWAVLHRPVPLPPGKDSSAEQMALFLNNRSQLHALLTEPGPRR